ncbi:hypothetical protein JPSP39_05000 [Staphylococcus pseudintermedius]
MYNEENILFNKKKKIIRYINKTDIDIPMEIKLKLFNKIPVTKTFFLLKISAKYPPNKFEATFNIIEKVKTIPETKGVVFSAK